MFTTLHSQTTHEMSCMLNSMDTLYSLNRYDGLTQQIIYICGIAFGMFYGSGIYLRKCYPLGL